MNRRFDPQPASLRGELWYSALGVLIAGPVLLWWKDVSWVWGVLILTATSVGMVGADFWRCRVRGRDAVELGEEGVRVENRRKRWSMTWQDIARVYRFKELLAFETVTNRREYLQLEGHEAHQRELLAAIAEHARTRNLRWFDTVAALLG